MEFKTAILRIVNTRVRIKPIGLLSSKYYSKISIFPVCGIGSFVSQQSKILSPSTSMISIGRKQLKKSPVSICCAFSESRSLSSEFNHKSIESQPKVLHGKIADETQNLLSFLSEVIKLRDVRPPSLTVENKLKVVCFYYENFTTEEKEEFLKRLSCKFSVNHDGVWNLCKQQLSSLETNEVSLVKVEEKLRKLLQPDYSWIFTHLSRLEKGTQFLINLRKDVLDLLLKVDSSLPEYLSLQLLDKSLKDTLGSALSPALFQLQKVKWTSPCSLLEKIAQYEAVHPIKGWTEIKQRTGPYRRCFIYTHQSLPGEPLIILHVALTNQIEHSVTNIILNNEGSKDTSSLNALNFKEDPTNINAFIFYSISSTQKGLQGIDLGNYLIKQACYELHEEFPLVKRFSTLSPIPTYRKWLIEQMETVEKDNSVLQIKQWKDALNIINTGNQTESWAKLKQMIGDNSWFNDKSLVEALKMPLTSACSVYLYLVKKRGYAYDSVANFHLRNGAVLWRLNWLADTSPRGLKNSCGLMVNYRYYLDAVDSNSLKYVQQKTLTASEEIIQLATGRPS